MRDFEQILSCLEKTPEILAGLLTQIPGDLLKTKRLEHSWSIHEHACHIATGDGIGVLDRLRLFFDEECPVFLPLSGESFPPDHLMKMNLDQAIDGFFKERAEVVRRAKFLDASLLEKEGKHPEYGIFTPYVMLRHRLMHDYYHMYRIEDLWLAK